MTKAAESKAAQNLAAKSALAKIAAGQSIVKDLLATVRCLTEEKTKRVELETVAAVEIEKIRSFEKVLVTYLDRSFDERAVNFKRLFSALDTAIASDNLVMVQSTLVAVVQLADSSPFKQLGNIASAKKALAKKGTEWEL